MDPITLLVIAVALGTLAYAVFGKDKLAMAIRALFVGAQSKFADAFDDAANQMDAAIAQDDVVLADANTSLTTVKTSRKGLERKLEEAKRLVAHYKTNAENFASVGKKDLVMSALAQAQAFQAEVDALQSSYDVVLKSEQEIQAAVNNTMKHRAELTRDRSSIKSRLLAAKTKIEAEQVVSQIRAGLQNNHASRAIELVEQYEAKAAAVSEVVNSSTSKQQLDAAIKELAEQTDLDAEAAELMAKYEQKVDRLSTPEPQTAADNNVTETASLTGN